MKPERKTHVTITEAWKRVFRDLMTSKAPIAVPMSREIFRPEVHEDAPRPCLLSRADLVTIFLFHRWFDLGLRFDDLEGTQPVDIEAPELIGVGIPSSIGGRSARDAYADQVFVLKSERTTFWFDCRGLQPHVISSLFPQGSGIALGPDRIIQRFMEAWHYRLLNIVRPVPRGPKARSYHVFFVPLPNSNINRGDWEPNSLWWLATGERLYVDPELASNDYQHYELGFTAVPIPHVCVKIDQRLAELE